MITDNSTTTLPRDESGSVIFFRDYCRKIAFRRLRVSIVSRAYKKWCNDHGWTPVHPKSWGAVASRQGYTRDFLTRKYYINLELVDAVDNLSRLGGRLPEAGVEHLSGGRKTADDPMEGPAD